MAEADDLNNEAALRSQVLELEDEIAELRRKLIDAPKRQRALEERLLETKGQLAQAVSQNEKLSYTLREAREHIAALRDEVDKLTQPPSAYGMIVGKNDDGTVDVLTSGRKMRVSLHPEIDHDALDRGSEVVLNESFNVVQARTPEVTGEVVTIKEILDDGVRALIVGRADGIPMYAVSIAYVEDGQAQLGAVYNPTIGEFFLAERGRGATLNGQPIHVSGAQTLDQKRGIQVRRLDGRRE